jgi:membrane protease subunit HflK
MFDVFQVSPMNDHPHSHGEHGHDHGHDHEHATLETPVEAGSQALAEALHSSFAIVKVVMVVLVVVFLGSGFFKVEPDQRAIILRFGKPVGEGQKALLGPGLHWSFPYPIDEVEKVSITGIQKVSSTSGWYATTPEQELAGTEPPAGPGTPLNPAVDGYAITADANIIHTRATLTYRIDDPVRYVFGFVNASNVLQNALNNALIYTASHFAVDDILYRDVAGFKDAVRRSAADLIQRENVGVAIDEIVDLRSIPPRQVKPSFDAVVTAGQNRNKVLNEAHSYENQITNQAGATAVTTIDLAESDRVRLVNDMASQAARFQEILPNYRTNSMLFVQSRFNETMSRVLTNLQEKIFMPSRADGKTRELRLLLNREPPMPKPAATQ